MAQKTRKKAAKVSAPAEPHVEPTKPEPHVTCGARLKGRPGTCTKPAGWRTDHPGQGKCHFHGGATPIKHGRYSSIQRADLREKIEKFTADPDPLNLAPEVALLRAFVEEFIERWDAIYGPDGALLAWHESYLAGKEDRERKPRELPDFSSITNLVDKVGRMVERIHKFQHENALGLPVVNRIVEQMGADLIAALNETKTPADQTDAILAAVERRWNSIRLDAGRSGGPGTAALPIE